MIRLYSGKNSYESWNAFILEKKKFKENKDIEVREVNGDEISSVSDLVDSTQSMSFFANESIVFAKRLLKNKSKKLLEELLEYLESHDAEIVLWEDGEPDKRTRFFKFISKKGEHKDFAALNPGKIIFWLRKIFEENNIEASDSVLNKMINQCGIDQSILSSEAEKLKLYLQSLGRKELKVEDIEEICAVSFEESIWEFVDSLSLKSKSKALNILENIFKETQDYQIILGILTRQLRILYSVNMFKHLSPMDIAAKIGERSFVVSKIFSLASSMQQHKIEKAFERLLNLDKMIKNSLIDPKLGLNLFVLSI